MGELSAGTGKYTEVISTFGSYGNLEIEFAEFVDKCPSSLVNNRSADKRIPCLFRRYKDN
jgi:hypothetical protein